MDSWLGCGLLQTNYRPVPLIEGVMDRSGAFTRLGPNGPETLQLIGRHEIRQRRQNPSSQDMIVPLVRSLIEAGKKLLFS